MHRGAAQQDHEEGRCQFCFCFDCLAQAKLTKNGARREPTSLNAPLRAQTLRMLWSALWAARAVARVSTSFITCADLSAGTLLNLLFGTQFREMNAQIGRQQTTRGTCAVAAPAEATHCLRIAAGIWLDCGRDSPDVVVMVGCDSMCRVFPTAAPCCRIWKAQTARSAAKIAL